MHSTTSLRISTFLWQDEARRLPLLSLLQEYRDTIEEVAFFTSFTHSVLPLAVIEREAEELAEIIPTFKAAGLRVGINHLATIGHLDENLINALDEPWQRLMDIDGTTARGSYCPQDPDFLAFTASCYAALAHTGTDFIWLDDDIRMGHHPPAKTGCFCPRCLADFAVRTQREWTRDTLRAAFAAGGAAGLTLRKQWLAQNRATIQTLLQGIRQAVDTVNPALPLGLMTCDMLYEGADFPGWVAALAGKANIQVKWRPGGGVYNDDQPLSLLGKAHAIGGQANALPAQVSDIQSELENFPYYGLKKSATFFGAEVLAYLGAGCTGVAINCMGDSYPPFTEYRQYFEKAREIRHFGELAVQAFGRSTCEGIWLARTPDIYATGNPEGDWFTGLPGGQLNDTAEIGLPLAYAPAGKSVSVLFGDAPLSFTPEALRELLTGGVLLDGPALAHLNAMGLSAYTGFEIDGEKLIDMQEKFTDDPLNGIFAGQRRDCRPSFWPQSCYLVRPLAPTGRLLSQMIDFDDTDFGGASGVFENTLGGRVAVFGYYPWSYLHSLAKATQMKAIHRWLSRDTVPAYVASYHKAGLWCRRTDEGKPAMLLLNASLDPAKDLTLALRAAHGSLTMTRIDGRQTELVPGELDGAYTHFTLPSLQSWEVVLLQG
ncbi:MAG TPA: hypothetical protein VGL77_06745 [Armatimonadota bacterium]|jgi:hypothetical protein